MQVPEKLALIGGSILLSSALIFTLKSQASRILPRINSSNEQVYQGITKTDIEHDMTPFKDAFPYAQKQGWQTGTWGSSKYYIDDEHNMHIGPGALQGSLYSLIGEGAHQLHSIDLDDRIQAPTNSDSLFMGKTNSDVDNGGDNQSIQAINGLNRLDVSHTTSMQNMFYRDYGLTHLDVNDWDTSHVQSIVGIFARTDLDSLDLSHWDTKNITNYSWAFYNDEKLKNLDISGWDSSNGINMAYTFKDTGINAMSIGNHTKVWDENGLEDTQWQNGSHTANVPDESYPGTWVKQ